MTGRAESVADFIWGDTAINLSGGAPGYVVSVGDENALVWINGFDDFHYLFQRRPHPDVVRYGIFQKVNRGSLTLWLRYEDCEVL